MRTTSSRIHTVFNEGARVFQDTEIAQGKKELSPLHHALRLPVGTHTKPTPIYQPRARFDWWSILYQDLSSPRVRVNYNGNIFLFYASSLGRPPPNIQYGSCIGNWSDMPSQVISEKANTSTPADEKDQKNSIFLAQKLAFFVPRRTIKNPESDIQILAQFRRLKVVYLIVGSIEKFQKNRFVSLAKAVDVWKFIDLDKDQMEGKHENLASALKRLFDNCHMKVEVQLVFDVC
ncbi:hypothetical protein F5Y19DRAFT_475475 [Xylariaceae sp. FL1651]|nr:hypothetical protein F5Y19DRAFT_475475 [Xylariaceae sp. FL1651]